MKFIQMPGTDLMMQLDPGAEKNIKGIGHFSLDDPEWIDARCRICHGSQVAFARVFFHSDRGITRVATVQDCKWCRYFRGPILN